MAILKERCLSCGGTISFLQNSNVGECDYCGTIYSLSELQEMRKSITIRKNISKETDCDIGNKAYGSALDTSGADEISLDELCEKSEIALESEKWQIADSFSDEILRKNPKFAKAYLYKLLAEYEVFKKEALANLKEPFYQSDNYRLLMRFADMYLKAEVEGYAKMARERYISETLENRYQELFNQMRNASAESDYQSLADYFHNLDDYKDSQKLAAECLKRSQRASKRSRAKAKRKKLLVKLVIVGIILAIIGVPILEKASYRGELFSVEITDKVNVGYDYDTASFVFKFNIINNSPHNANYMEGYITISDVEGTVLASGTTWFSGVIASKNSNYHELSLELNRSVATTRLWNTDCSDLVIKYRITEIHFEDGTVKEYRGEDAIVNKS